MTDIEIGEALGEHPRRPGPRLMRRAGCDPVATHDPCSLPPLWKEGAAQAAAHRGAMKPGWHSDWLNGGQRVRAEQQVKERQRAMARKFAEMQLIRESGAAD